jgi:hypothetical protein
MEGQLSFCNRKSISSTCSRFRHVFSSILWGGTKFSCAVTCEFPVKSISSQKGKPTHTPPPNTHTALLFQDCGIVAFISHTLLQVLFMAFVCDLHVIFLFCYCLLLQTNSREPWWTQRGGSDSLILTFCLRTTYHMHHQTIHFISVW